MKLFWNRVCLLDPHPLELQSIASFAAVEIERRPETSQRVFFAVSEFALSSWFVSFRLCLPFACFEKKNEMRPNSQSRLRAMSVCLDSNPVFFRCSPKLLPQSRQKMEEDQTSKSKFL